MFRSPILFILILAFGIIFFSIGKFQNQDDLIPRQMTYGNFDIEGHDSFVNHLFTGIPDLARARVYLFDEIHWHPLIALLGVIFPLTLFWGLYKNRECAILGINRVLAQWTVFVLARIGLLRASGIFPIKRSCFGIFPFLNCQACEMTSGACPIGLLQNLLSKGIFPFHLLGVLIFSGLIFGKSICGWFCPFGFISDLFDKISLKRWRLPNFTILRFVTILIVVFAPIAYFCIGVKERNFFCGILCGSGKILGIFPYYLTYGAPAFFSLESWLGSNSVILFLQVGLTLSLLIAMLLVSGRVFCRTLCPLGAIWGAFNYVSLAGVNHDSKKCGSCGLCEKVCPMGVSKNFQGFSDRTSCLACGRCVEVCNGARSFRMGLSVSKKDGGVDKMNYRSGYGSFFNQLRRDVYLLILSLAAKTPLGMARYAFEQTGFYRKHYGQPPEDFTALPIVRKKDLGQIDPYEILSAEMSNSVTLYGETTGSSGFPTPVFFSEREFHAARIFSCITPFVGDLEEVLSENRAVINGLTFGFTIAGTSFGDFLQARGGMVANVGTRSTIATPERMVRALSRIKPSVLTGTPIDFLSWMRILKEDYPREFPIVLEELKVLLSTAELCSQSRSRAIQKEFGVVHVDIYASVEGFFVIPCPCGEKHILPIYHTELFDEKLKFLGTTGEGRFAFTNLAKKSTPFVRYLLDDFVTIYPSKCQFKFSRSIEPHGRWELTSVINGRRYGVRHFEEAIFRHGLFGDYRVVIQDSKIEVLAEEYGEHGSIDSMIAGISDEFGLKAEVRLVPFGTITKYREIRQSKPILKIEDHRTSSTQVLPEYL
ncbi:MAG: 4Fe-4S binding protein [Candidatus Riflebacteria bacterium]|nr:4Fe-4S binding protein [Candidatus Riflebacteria bacterium]